MYFRNFFYYGFPHHLSWEYSRLSFGELFGALFFAEKDRTLAWGIILIPLLVLAICLFIFWIFSLIIGL